MRYTKLPNTDLEVSVICLGSWVFGGDCWGEACDDTSEKVVKVAVEKGVNFIDTAPVYGAGRSEEVIGRAISGMQDKPIIATKLGLEQKGKSIRPNLKASFIREEVENSLRRLDIERIDLYQCHWPDPSTPIEESFGQMRKLVDEGKIKYIGVSNFERELLERVSEIAPVVSDQVRYSLLEREAEHKLMPFCEEKELSILPYGALGGGILTGKYKDSPSLMKGDVRSFFYKYYAEPFWSKAVELVKCLEEIAARRGRSSAEVAINWTIWHDTVPSCIVGCRTPEQLDKNLAAGEWELSREEVEAIEKRHWDIFFCE